MRVVKSCVVEGAALAGAWEMYRAAFAELRAIAAHRQVLTKAEFQQVMLDRRIDKYLISEEDGGDRPLALATFTNTLEAMPLLSPEFFAHRWPDLYAHRQIWYLGFFAIDEARRSQGIFENMISEMWSQVPQGGMAALDMCVSRQDLGLAKAIERTLQRLTPQVTAECVDMQTVWAFRSDSRG
jgi:hypothetical protein